MAKSKKGYKIFIMVIRSIRTRKWEWKELLKNHILMRSYFKMSLIFCFLIFFSSSKIVELMEDAEGKMDLSRLVLQCIHSDYVREAIHLLPKQPLIRQNNHLYSNAMVYIREMVHAKVVSNFTFLFLCTS